MSTRRLRIFAGPNGSGKSTIYADVDKEVGCRYFVNADEIQARLSDNGKLSFTNYTILISREHFADSFRNSGFFERCRFKNEILDTFAIKDNVLIIDPRYADSYFSAFVADFLRTNMLNIVDQFCIETVMSDRRKIDYIRIAKAFGYRIYLYFVSTKDVNINIGRVATRVQAGGHDVPEEKIKKRYKGSLENVYEVLTLCDRAYFFDNSESHWVKLAEYHEGTLYPTQQMVPRWFYDYVYVKSQEEK